jgi:hypothetical protein
MGHRRVALLILRQIGSLHQLSSTAHRGVSLAEKSIGVRWCEHMDECPKAQASKITDRRAASVIGLVAFPSSNELQAVIQCSPHPAQEFPSDKGST